MKTTKAKNKDKDIAQEVEEEFQARKIIREFEDDGIPNIHKALKKFMQKLHDIQVDYHQSNEAEALAKNKKPIDKFVAEFIIQLNIFLGQSIHRSSIYEKLEASEQMRHSIESSYSKILPSLETTIKPNICKFSHTRYEDFGKGHELLEDFLDELIAFTCMRFDTQDKIQDVFQTITEYIYAKQNY